MRREKRGEGEAEGEISTADDRRGRGKRGGCKGR
jgi:hypothetical protein